jgi:hypothetical protein
VSRFPEATGLTIDGQVLCILTGNKPVASFPRETVWSAGNTEACPVLS